MEQKKLHFETLQVHAGMIKDETGARGLPIYPTAAYRFQSCDHAAKLFELTTPGNLYTRLHNPTSSAFEERIAALEGGVGALAVGSGMAAELVAFTSLARAGHNIVASPHLYGGSFTLLNNTLRKLGIECRMAASERAQDMEPLIDDNTRAIYVESMSNPACVVPDLEALAALARRHDVPLVVDNTFGAGGYLCRPIEWGANIVVESSTKWINGHGIAMGGVIVDAGNYNWNNGKYPDVAGPSEGYHGLNMWETFGNKAFIVKCRVDGLRDLGTCPSPFDSYLMALGLETLSLRAQHVVDTTHRLAQYLNNHPMVKKVNYVGLPDNPSHANAQKYFRTGGGAVLSVELKGTLDTTIKVVEACKLFQHMTMIGDSVSVITHPASTTHKQLSDDDLAAMGVTPTLLRLSPGLEHCDDLIADLEQAFERL
ncbi:MAG: aminotransferase class I/II-fold pyridoxal phosphate-dependent enzyme [Muribaculaceae bacterium]|nr:aminotransferase class I/II-fold pyridoxal phosphate-dependent enzyme [Muribaculaceae bacterium]